MGRNICVGDAFDIKKIYIVGPRATNICGVVLADNRRRDSRCEYFRLKESDICNR